MKHYISTIQVGTGPALPAVLFDAPSDAKAKAVCRKQYRRVVGKTIIGDVQLLLELHDKTMDTTERVAVLGPGTEPDWHY